MRKSVKRAVMNRLNYAIGHLEGVKQMAKADADTLQLLQQTRAISSHLRSIDTLLLSSHFADTTQAALDAKTKRRLKKALRQLVQIYQRG